MKRLFLLRHGKATKYQDDNTDYKRSLNKQGTAQVNQVGYILQSKKINFDHILASSAFRTFETAEIINFYLHCKSVDYLKELYLANQHEILKHVCNFKNDFNTILYVGHNNGISDLASYLSEESLLLSTSQLIELKFETDDWRQISAGTAQLGMNLKPEVHAF